MNILADASLPGLDCAFPKPFHLTRYAHPDEITSLLKGQDILLCRANLKVDYALLEKHQLRYVATASSGTDHLDQHWLATQNIRVIDAKGCNARSVADYIVSCIAYLDQKQLMQGNHAGIIGYGKVGTHVTSRLHTAGFTTVIYDPLKELKEPQTFQSSKLEDLWDTDLLCIHAELHDNLLYPSRHLLNQQFLTQLKPGCIIINAARGGIIDEIALLNHIKKQELIYCTDVYLNEPKINQHIVEIAELCTPHIAGHSLEAKYLAVAMVSKTLHQLEKLPTPQFAIPEINHIAHLKGNKTWQKNILSLYNPINETIQLKQTRNLEATFLELRKAHQKRHDFLIYTNPTLDAQTRSLLGE